LLASFFKFFQYSFKNKSFETNFRISWTDFQHIFTIWQVFDFDRRLRIRPSSFDCSRDVAIATNFGLKLPTPPSFIVLAFLNGFEDRNSNLRILHANDFCTLLTDLSPRPFVGLSACLSVRKVYCGKRLIGSGCRYFRVVSGDGRGWVY